MVLGGGRGGLPGLTGCHFWGGGWVVGVFGYGSGGLVVVEAICEGACAAGSDWLRSLGTRLGREF